MRKSLTEQIRIHAEEAIHADMWGKPLRASQENRKAIKICERLLKILNDNQAIYECHEFLIGSSAITRKAKKK